MFAAAYIRTRALFRGHACKPLAPAPTTPYLGRMAIKTQTDAAAFPLPAAVLRDLLDHDLDTLEVARRHDLDPAAVRAAVRSDAFRQAAESMREADQARTAAVWPSIQARAIHRLARIANQPTDTPTQTESARRALTALLKCKPPADTCVTEAPPHAESHACQQPSPPPAAEPSELSSIGAITGDPDATLEDALRMIAEIESMRPRASVPRPNRWPDPAPTPSTPAAQLCARAGAPSGHSP